MVGTSSQPVPPIEHLDVSALSHGSGTPVYPCSKYSSPGHLSEFPFSVVGTSARPVLLSKVCIIYISNIRGHPSVVTQHINLEQWLGIEYFFGKLWTILGHLVCSTCPHKKSSPVHAYSSTNTWLFLFCLFRRHNGQFF